MTVAYKDAAAIAKYLRKRLEYLRACNADVENRLSDDAVEFINTCNNEDTCSRYLFHIESVVGNTFRYSMLLAVCTFLEESVRLLCDCSLIDYGKKLDSYRRGTWLAKHRRILRDHTLVDVAAIEGDLDTMEEFVQVRNCIAHAWGKVDGCRNEQQLRNIVNRADCFNLSADGYLLVEDGALPTAVIAAGHIVNTLLEDLLGLRGDWVY